MPIQQASYRGVRFDVLSVDDNLERAPPCAHIRL